MQESSWKEVVFPFSVTRLHCRLDGILSSLGENQILLILDAGRRLEGVPWSSALQRNFVYVPSTPSGADVLEFEVVSKSPWSEAKVGFHRWSPDAPRLESLARQFSLTANGPVGEELRETEIGYEWSLGSTRFA